MSAWIDELRKIASFSSPTIKAPPTPGSHPTSLKPTPAAPVKLSKITGKALKSTTLAKTNYTNVQTAVPKPDFSQAAEQKALTPPVVRS